MRHVTARRRVKHLTAGELVTRPETLVVEEPLEIRVNGTRGHRHHAHAGRRLELAPGFLLTEGVVAAPRDVLTVAAIAPAPDDANTYNVVDVTRRPACSRPTVDVTATSTPPRPAASAARRARRRRTSAARTLVTTPTRRTPPAAGGVPDAAAGGAAGLRPHRRSARRGAVHADGELLAVREDVGRHNAVDKLVGRALRNERLPLAGACCWSAAGRRFELAQKAVMAGIPVLAAVSAPSSLAVDLAGETGLTLVGSCAADSMNVYRGRGPHPIAVAVRRQSWVGIAVSWVADGLGLHS